jgi:hypothetical protein
MMLTNGNMKRPFPSILKYLGIPVVGVAWVLAARLAWEQTVWSWQKGPQMVGFSLLHAGPGIPLILGTLVGLLWVAAVFAVVVVRRNLGGKVILCELAAYGLAWAVLMAPYGFWQRLFIWKFTPSQAREFFTFDAATGDLTTVKAFVKQGMPVNAQGRNGTALHAAAVAGEIEVIEFLIAQGANVNATNAYGDSPLANALDANKRAAETQALLKKHGAQLVRGSAQQRDRVIQEQVREDIEKLEKKLPQLERNLRK